MQKIGEPSHGSTTLAKLKKTVHSRVAAVAKVAGPCRFGLAPWKEHARCNSHPGKRVPEVHQLEPPSKSPQLSPRRFLVRLGESI